MGMLLGQTPDPVAGAWEALADGLFQLIRSLSGFFACGVDASKRGGGKLLLTVGWCLRPRSLGLAGAAPPILVEHLEEFQAARRETT